MGIENPIHLIFLGAVALIVLGPKKLPELARTLGKGIRELREAMSGISTDDPHDTFTHPGQPQSPPPTELPPEG